MSVADELLSPASRWQRRRYPVTVGEHRTFVLDEGAGEPVVFLHGIPTQGFLWRDVAAVVARDSRSLAPDLLGFGFADRPEGADYGPPAQARFIKQVLDELGIDRFALVAHDFGALVASDFICRNPGLVTKLVLTNTSMWREDWDGGRLTPFGLLRMRGVGETAFRLARPFMLAQAFRLYTSDRARLTDETMQVYWHPFQDGYARVLLSLAREDPVSEDDFCRWRDTLAAFRGPSLVVWGGQDPTFRTNRGHAIANLLPGGHFELFEHANHFVPEDRPNALGRLILAFIDGRYPPA
ncbi:MAG TPA: alpha/beta fold hydrolase [Thermomicrobiales bacterium]|nr:alpha/beta fold hydrolase [Thermomicrobiales bacterium]